jgi:FkbM family methyltransferase
MIRGVEVIADGLKWEVDPADHDGLGPSHEDEITPLVLGLLPEGGTFLDVGAHVGHYALRAARKAASVIAVEPNPATAERLRHNAFINELRNVHVVEVAAWDGACPMRLERVHSYVRDGSGRVFPDTGGKIWGARLDDALNQYPLRPDRLDLVKLDVEGADLQALDGMRGLIARHRPALVIEDHSYLGYYTRRQLAEVVVSLGYQWQFAHHEDGGAAWWRCWPEPAPSTPPSPS